MGFAVESNIAFMDHTNCTSVFRFVVHWLFIWGSFFSITVSCKISYTIYFMYERCIWQQYSCLDWISVQLIHILTHKHTHTYTRTQSATCFQLFVYIKNEMKVKCTTTTTTTTTANRWRKQQVQRRNKKIIPLYFTSYRNFNLK